jgi:branched-chain amino acid transport system permease protein
VPPVLANFVAVVFDGLSFGMLLFLMSVGLSVTLGIMRFLNLAHGASAMLGGYVVVTLAGRAGVPFLPAVALATLAAVPFTIILEMAVFRRLYRASHLHQVLLTIGIVFMAIGAATYVWGPNQQPVHVPAWLTGSVTVAGVHFGTYRLFLLGVSGILTLLLVLGVEKTTLGARVRAAVDDRRMATVVGINVDWVFTLSFAVGGALAGLGGALSVYMVGLDPNFPLTYLVLYLLVVSVGGLGSIGGTLLAAIILGICDVLGKYYVPQVGAFLIYAVMVSLLLMRPAGLIRRGA